MTDINELKLDIIKRGFQIIERGGQPTPEGLAIVQFRIEKFDTDGLLWMVEGAMEAVYYGSRIYIDSFKEGVRFIDEAIMLRHSANPNICDHNEVIIDDVHRKCTKCMVRLSDKIRMDLNFN